MTDRITELVDKILDCADDGWIYPELITDYIHDFKDEVFKAAYDLGYAKAVEDAECQESLRKLEGYYA